MVLVVCDDVYPLSLRVKQPDKARGIWVYRDWNAEANSKGTLCAKDGDLRVYDVYSATSNYGHMKTDQIAKYNRYDGRCMTDRSVPCDLFLLSWTLTPKPSINPATWDDTVWTLSKRPNSSLAAEMAKLEVPNKHGCVPNLLYVDYVETSRVTDVAVLLNRRIRK